MWVFGYGFRFWFFCIDNNLNQGFEHTRNPLYHRAINLQPLKHFLDLNKCLKVYQSQKANLSWDRELVEQEKAIVKKTDNLSLGLWNSYKKPSSTEHCVISVFNTPWKQEAQRIFAEAHGPASLDHTEQKMRVILPQTVWKLRNDRGCPLTSTHVGGTCVPLHMSTMTPVIYTQE